MKVVSEQVKMLLERMDLYPEEFTDVSDLLHRRSKWESILTHGTFNLVERFLIHRKYKQIRRAATQQSIVSTLLYEPNDKEVLGSADPLFSTTSRFSDELSKKMVVNKAQMEALRMRLLKRI